MNITSRRDWMKAVTAGAVAASGSEAFGAALPPLKGTADACIFLWLGGGAAHVDTFDPKKRGDGAGKAGSYYDSIDTAIPKVQLCEHLKQTALLMEHCALIRSLNHDIASEHAAAANLVHTGRKPSGTILYPSIGSIALLARCSRLPRVQTSLRRSPSVSAYSQTLPVFSPAADAPL
jgi:hypothetical protein